MLVVAACPKCGGKVMGSGSFGLHLCAEISTGLWMVHSNSIKIINDIVAKVVCKNGKEEGGTHTCTCGCCFSLLFRRGHGWWLGIMSFYQDINWPVDDEWQFNQNP